jgi:putative glutamine amidotransferase
VKIGITHTGRDDKHMNYVKWIQANDPAIEIVALSAENGQKVEECDALVLSGGIDMHPAFYNGSTSYDNSPAKFKEARDRFEMDAFATAVHRKMPVLGICRGLQLINVCCKGTLIQDLGRSKNMMHRDVMEADQKTEHDNQHNVKVESGSVLHDIVKVNSGVVNSAHHQGILQLGEELVANSYSEDGVIEGIEWKEARSRPFMLAVQWHPERMHKSGIEGSPLSKNIRDHFITEVKSNLKK